MLLPHAHPFIYIQEDYILHVADYINKLLDSWFCFKIDYQASFPLEFQVQCVQLPKYVNKIG